VTEGPAPFPPGEQAVRPVRKPWGHELLFARTALYAGKVIFIRAGEALSLQYHRVKDESIYIQSGRLKLEFGEPGQAADEGAEGPLANAVLRPGQAWRIPAMTRHRFVAIEDTHLFEVSTPDLEDVVRLEDRYGRQGTIEP
jgi:mannose-6-phosphate isomerase